MEVLVTDPELRRLMTLPGVGPITATAFIAALDDTSRLHSPGQSDELPGLGAIRVQLGRETTAGTRAAKRASAGPGTTGAGSLARLALAPPGDRGLATMDPGDRRAPRQQGGGRDPGPAPRTDSLRHVARRDEIHRSLNRTRARPVRPPCLAPDGQDRVNGATGLSSWRSRHAWACGRKREPSHRECCSSVRNILLRRRPNVASNTERV